jgi:hypothetical protein
VHFRHGCKRRIFTIYEKFERSRPDVIAHEINVYLKFRNFENNKLKIENNKLKIENNKLKIENNKLKKKLLYCYCYYQE